MSRELSRLEAALRATSPRAPESARERAIARAMAAFDRHHREASDEERHRGEAPKRGAPWMRRLATLLPRPPLALAGSVAVVALAGIVSHQVLVGPQAPPSDVAAPASHEAPPAAPGRAPDAAPEVAEAERVNVAKSIEPGLREEVVEAPASLTRMGESGGLLRMPDTIAGSAARQRSSPSLEREPGVRRYHAQDRDRSAEPTPGPVTVVAEEPVSTFPVDIDTDSYDMLRASLLAGHLPDEDAVRTEALVNRFSYDYAPPETRDPPFATHVTVTPAPWNDAARLLHIGIQGYAPDRSGARRVLLQETTSTPVIIAKDVTIEVEFNPAAVGEYRLVGQEPRMPARAGARDDGVDAEVRSREIVAGHAVTAIYELVPAGSGARRTPASRQGNEEAEPRTGVADEYAYLTIRYTLPDAERSIVLTRPVTTADAVERMDAASRDVRFAVAAAAFGELLRGGGHSGDYGYDDVIALADGARGEDPLGERQEFVRLVHLARSAAAVGPRAVVTGRP